MVGQSSGITAISIMATTKDRLDHHGVETGIGRAIMVYGRSRQALDCIAFKAFLRDAQSMTSRRLPSTRWQLAFVLLALGIIALGIGFRIWHLSANPLWLDEGYSAYAAAKGFDFLWHVVPLYETHPPFYYSLLRIWTLCFGDSVLALRSLGLLGGILTIGVCALAARELGKLLKLDQADHGMLILFATMLMALATLPIEMSRAVRPYALIILVYTSLIALVLRLARRTDSGQSLGSGAFVLYLVFLTLLLWLHNMGILYAAAVGMAFLTLCLRPSLSKRDWYALVAGHLAVFLLWLPALLILSGQAPTWIKSTWLTLPPGHRLIWYVTRLFVVPEGISLLAALFLIAMAWSSVRRAPLKLRVVGALSILMFLPVALSIGISLLVAPVFILRVLSAVAVPACLLFALAPLSTSHLRRAAGLVALAILTVQLVISDIAYRQLPPPENWYGAVAWLHKRMQPGDVVFAYPNEGALPFRYAVRDKGLIMPTRPIPTDIPTLDGGPGAWNPTGSRGVFSLPPNRLKQIADEPASRAIPTIWLMRLGPWKYDPGDHFLHALLRSRVRVGRFAAPPLEIVGLRRKDLPPVAPPEQAKP
jgi:mannosyltransferase